MQKKDLEIGFKDLDKITYLKLNVADLCLNPQLDSLPVLLCGIQGPSDATIAREYLVRFFAPDTPVCFCKAGKQAVTVLKNLDKHGSYDEGRVLIVANQGFDKKIYTFGDLIRILEYLTGENGCPWDKQQTHQTIRSNMIEEAYEAALAMDSGDQANLIEELGDVMLQSVFHTDIARRGGEFCLSDVISALCRKLYTRHTHIFGDKTATGAEEALKRWEDAKAAEKTAENKTASAQAKAGEGTTVKIKDYAGLPSLLRAQKVYKKMAATDAKMDKKTTLAQNKQACIHADMDFGRQLFCLVSQCEQGNTDAETALNTYIDSLVKAHSDKMP